MNNKVHIFIKALLLAIILFYAVSILHPAYWNWGTFAVFGKTISLAILAVILAVLLITPVSRALYKLLNQTLSSISNALGGLPRIVKAFLWIIIPAVSLFLLRTNSHILGDGDTILSNILNGLTASPSMYGFGMLLNKASDVFHIADKSQAAILLASISIISGSIFLYFLYKTINLVESNSKNKNLLFLLIASSSIIVLFAGYIESYPILVAWLSVYIYYSLLYLNDRGKGNRLAFIFIIGLFWNLWFIAFLPSLIYTYNQKVRVVPVKIITGLTFLYIVGIYFGGQLVRRGGLLISLPLMPGKETNYTLFGPMHLVDFLNELIIIGPIMALLAILLIFFLRKVEIRSESKFLLFAAIPSLLMSFMIDPIIGAVRDWDLLSIFGLPLMLLGLVIFQFLIKQKSSLAYLIPGILLLNIFHTSGYIVNNKNTQKAVDRAVNVLMRDPHYQTGYYGAKKNTTMAVILANEYNRYADAIEFMRKKVDAKSTDVNDIALLANYCFFEKRYDEASRFFDLVRDKVYFFTEERMSYGYSLYFTKQYSRAIEQLRIALEDTCSNKVAICIASSFAQDYQRDSCQKYCEISIACSQDSIQAMHNIVQYLPGWVFPKLKAGYETRVLAAYPDSLEIRNSLIHLFQQAGMPDSAHFYMNYGNRNPANQIKK